MNKIINGKGPDYIIQEGIPEEGAMAEVYKKAQEKWGVDLERDLMVMVYGKTMHKGFKYPIDPDLLVHEEVHVKQHTEYEGGPAAWWERYLQDPEFRINQEVEAYRRQYEWLKENEPDRNKRFKILVLCAKNLSGPMYGEAISMQNAMNAIRGMDYQILY